MSENEINSCPNCEQSYDQDFQYCPHCGQKNESSVLTFKEVFSDLLGSFFSFDSKAFNSLPKLIFKPGKLTNDYLNGKRASNLSPFKMYLFFSVVLFLLLPMIVNEDDILTVDQIEDVENPESKSKKVNLFDIIGDSLEVEVNKGRNRGVMDINFGDSLSTSKWYTGVELVKNGYSPKEATDSLYSNYGNFVKFFIGQGLKFNDKKGSGLIGVFLNSVSYALFLFLPLFALILKLLYVRRKRLYIEHFIFALHLFSFVFVILIFLTLLAIWKVEFPPEIAVVTLLLYLYVALFKTYKQGLIKTFFKNVSLLFMTTLFLMPIMILVSVAISVIFY